MPRPEYANSVMLVRPMITAPAFRRRPTATASRAAGGAADSASQASLQVMNRFLNRLPTITIREGHRVKVYLTSDLQLPAYQPSALAVPIRR